MYSGYAFQITNRFTVIIFKYIFFIIKLFNFVEILMFQNIGANEIEVSDDQ